MSAERVPLFSNGYEFDVWYERNCEGCARETKCDLLDAALIDGGFTATQAERAGYAPTSPPTLGWPCRERQAVLS